jgi:hypothetical protein
MTRNPQTPTLLRNRLTRCCALAGVMVFLSGATALADDLHQPHHWLGEWLAEGTDFRLRVIPQGNRFQVEPVFPLGLNWKAGLGTINGTSGTIHVEYEGVTAQVMVQLTEPGSAIVRSMSCQPDYHVICTLVRNQQARFIKHQ